jgi:transposase
VTFPTFLKYQLGTLAIGSGKVMVEVDGKEYWTVKEVSKHFGVASKTIYAWIRDGFAEEPPQTLRGRTPTYYFPQEWIDKVNAKREELRTKPRR